jgi:hypothetical protein
MPRRSSVSLEGDDAGVVGDEAFVMGRAQFDQRHRPTTALFNDLDSAGFEGNQTTSSERDGEEQGK